MTAWREATVAELCERVDYGYTASASEAPGLPRFLRITDIVGSHIDWRTVPGCEIDEQGLAKFRLEDGDIVVARTGATVGHAKRVRDLPLAVFASYLVRFRPARDIEPSFLGAVMESAAYKEWVRQNAGGAAQPNANAKTLGAFRLRIPDRSTQKRIGAIADAFEDLIENNRRRVEMLEEMARAIYREWFVHFRYPGHEDIPLVDSPLGPIPDGWKVVPLVELANVTMGQSPKSDFYNTDGQGKPFHQGVADFGTHYPTHRKYCTVEPRLALADDVLVSVRAPVGRINIADTTIVIGRGLAAIRSKTGHQSLLRATLRETFSQEDSMGSGTIFNAIGKRELEQLPVVWPPDDLAAEGCEVLGSLYEQIGCLTFANRQLCSLRDLLLPKLVTGQIDVTRLDLDELVEEAVSA